MPPRKKAAAAADGTDAPAAPVATRTSARNAAKAASASASQDASQPAAAPASKAKAKAPASKAKAPASKAKGKRKRNEDEEDDKDAGDDEPDAKKTKKAKDDDEAEQEKEKKKMVWQTTCVRRKKSADLSQVTVVKRGAAPVDPHSGMVGECPGRCLVAGRLMCTADTHQVYQNEEGVWDAMLNQTEVGKNANKYALLKVNHLLLTHAASQVLRHSTSPPNWQPVILHPLHPLGASR